MTQSQQLHLCQTSAQTLKPLYLGKPSCPLNSSLPNHRVSNRIISSRINSTPSINQHTNNVVTKVATINTITSSIRTRDTPSKTSTMTIAVATRAITNNLCQSNTTTTTTTNIYITRVKTIGKISLKLLLQHLNLCQHLLSLNHS